MTVTTDSTDRATTDRATGDRRTPAGSNRTTTCRCGQQLDCCARHHCPRCGRTLTDR